jgi:transketolase
LSGGHGSALLYAVLYLVGYENMKLSDLKNFRKLGSKATGHPEYDPNCGIETTTGPLGQGFANAVGMAIEERILNARLGDDCINHYTYVCAGDGDLMEGVVHEASSIAGHLSLGRLIVLFDDNNITIDGEVGVSSSEDTLKRYGSYGWHTLVADGHHEASISDAIRFAKLDPRPSIIACKTQIGLGTPRQGTSKAHSGPLTSDEMSTTRKNLNWHYDPFEIPEYIEKMWRVVGRKHSDTCKRWMQTQAKKYGSLEFEFSEQLRKTFRNIRKKYFISRPFAATRLSSQEIIGEILNATDSFISGSCDLGKSTGCMADGVKVISRENFSGNYIHYGIREHAMGAIMNGITVGKKIRCVGGTFLAFCDYMRPAIRMSALMNVPTIFVFSHDSIAVGEDGPTHQPVEHLASLRAIPNINVFRPADAMETMECWECALKSPRPSVIVLTRQDVLSVRFSGKDNICEKGGYLLHEDSKCGDAMITLIATGSEIGIALEVKHILSKKAISVNVVSMPCWNLFDEQTEDYKQHVLGNGLRIGVEASNGFGWEKYLGRRGLFFGVKNFGKSCSCLENYKHFDLTSTNISDCILKMRW